MLSGEPLQEINFLLFVFLLSTYTLTAPKNVRPLTQYQAVVTIHNTPEPVKVHVTVKCTPEGTNVTDQAGGEINVANGETKILDLDVSVLYF